MYSLEDEKFESILRDTEDETLCPDPGETAPGVVGSPTEEWQVLSTLAVTEGSYTGYCKQGGALAKSQLLRVKQNS